MSAWGILALAIAVVALAGWGTAFIRRLTLQHELLDVPNERSAHKQPTPTSAGAAIVVAFSLGLVFGGWCWGTAAVGRDWLPLLVSSAIVAGLGLVDDLRNLSARLRFGVQMAAALLFCVWAEPLRGLAVPGWGDLSFGLLAYPLSMLWLVAVTNFYNFMDGIDGLAAGTAVLVAGSFAWIAGASGGAWLPLVLLAAANVGFLFHNRPPAKIFMGDVGSGFLGFVLAGFAMTGQVRHGVPLAAFVLPLGMFILDTVVTLVRRAMRGERWYAAHRSHYYQRLMATGWSHARVDTLEFSLTLCFGLSGYFYFVTHSPVLRWGLASGVVGLFIGFTMLVRRAERRAESQQMSPAHPEPRGGQTA